MIKDENFLNAMSHMRFLTNEISHERDLAYIGAEGKTLHSTFAACCSVLQRVAACCNVLQGIERYCRVLQGVAG